MSRFIRKLWDFQRSMWDHRNEWLHYEEQGLHGKEKEEINSAIRLEFAIGRNGSSMQHASLFTERMDSMLGKDTNSKLQWLSSTWEGRHMLRRKEGLDVWYKDPLAS